MAATGVSVIIPVYNGAAHLGETLRSALAQTVLPLEILVIDDGSNDQSAALAESFGPPIRVIRQENRGEAAARNRGIDTARGDWIAFLDADDLWEPEKLARQLAAAQCGATCVHTNFYYFGAAEGRVDVSQINPSERYTPAHVACDNPFRISSLMVRRSLPLRFPEWTQDGEDLLYFLDLVQTADIALVPEFLTGYRVHPRGQSARPDILIRRYRAICEYLVRRGGTISPDTAQAVRVEFIRLMCRVAAQLKYVRDWPQYWTIRRYLGSADPSLPTDLPAEVAALQHERVYPRWAYRLKDALDRARGRC